MNYTENKYCLRDFRVSSYLWKCVVVLSRSHHVHVPWRGCCSSSYCECVVVFSGSDYVHVSYRGCCSSSYCDIVWSLWVEAIMFMFREGVAVLVHIVILFGRFEWKRICTRFLLFVGYNYAQSVNRNKQLISVTHEIGSCS